MKGFIPGGVLLIAVFGQDGAGRRGIQQEGPQPGREAQFAGMASSRMVWAAGIG